MHVSRPTAWHNVHVKCVAKLVEEPPEDVRWKKHEHGKRKRKDKQVEWFLFTMFLFKIYR
jgi:hypothetical protein